MKKQINFNKKNNIIFGIIFFILFITIGIYPLKSGGLVRIWSVSISLVFLIITIIRPNLFTHLNKLWIQFGILIGKIISPIVMCLIYLSIVTPVGILLRIFKKDVMGLKKGPSSYWIDKKDKMQSMNKQF
jgi:hypothetical protein